jgi:chloramphenicol 3-O phosphotransferase
MAGRVVIVNGPSSAGKSAIVDAFRERAESAGTYWHTVGIDDVFGRLSWRWVDLGWSIGRGPLADLGLSIVDGDGQSTMRVGPILRALLRGYQRGAVAFADEGISVIVDEVILDSVQLHDWRLLMGGRDVRWIGVRCDADEVERREAQRGDRPIGLARAQMPTVHRSIDYDLELDTTLTAPSDNAAALARFLETS